MGYPFEALVELIPVIVPGSTVADYQIRREAMLDSIAAEDQVVIP
jgi:hypothetical protein